MISHSSFKKCKWQENINTIIRDIRNSHNVKTINFMRVKPNYVRRGNSIPQLRRRRNQSNYSLPSTIHSNSVGVRASKKMRGRWKTDSEFPFLHECTVVFT
jgi:hypothetical protein